jgi:GNAT superfamily N-acetyltransferase
MPNIVSEFEYKTLVDTPGYWIVTANINQSAVCLARYQKSEDALCLQWLETKTLFQNKGYASHMLDYLYETAYEMGLGLDINIVDEELLNGFYFKWFHNKINQGEDVDQSSDTAKLFNPLVDETTGITLSIPYGFFNTPLSSYSSHLSL